MRGLLLAFLNLTNTIYVSFYTMCVRVGRPWARPVETEVPTAYLDLASYDTATTKVIPLTDVTISLFTFEKRQQTYLPVVLRQLRSQLPECPINVFINGNVDSSGLDWKARSSTIADCVSLGNVSVFSFRNFNGWSANTNYAAEFAATSYTLMVQDDVIISSIGLAHDVRLMLHIAKNHGICLANREFSVFMINTEFLDGFGWFDERFAGFGNEEAKFTQDYFRQFKEPVPSIRAKGLKHFQSTERGGDHKSSRSKHSTINEIVAQVLNEVEPGAVQPNGTQSPKPNWLRTRRLRKLLQQPASERLKEDVRDILLKPRTDRLAGASDVKWIDV